MTYFDRDHRKSKYVRFLTVSPLLQDLRCSPSRGLAVLARVTPYGIQVSSDCSEAKICDARDAGVVHKDVRLLKCKYGGDTISRTTTYPLEVSVNHIAGMEVA